MMSAELLMLVGGIVGFMVTLYWVRKREIREKWCVPWLALAVLLLFFGSFPDVVMAIATWARLSYATAVLAVSLTIIYFFAFSVTVSLSRQYHRNLRLTQEVALLEQRLRHIEECQKHRIET
jgi:hypothetical protein